jgi:hypothetical protein
MTKTLPFSAFFLQILLNSLKTPNVEVVLLDTSSNFVIEPEH